MGSLERSYKRVAGIAAIAASLTGCISEDISPVFQEPAPVVATAVFEPQKYELVPLVVDKPVLQENKPSKNIVILPELTEGEKKVQEVIDQAVKDYANFTFSIDGKTITSTVPYGQLTDYYKDFPRSTSTGIIPSKGTPKETHEIFEQARKSGKLEDLYGKNLKKYAIKPTEEEMAKLDASERVMYEVLLPEERALRRTLIDLGIFLDCNGAVYNILQEVYDATHGQGGFDTHIKKVFPDLLQRKRPVGWFNIERFENDRFTEKLGMPAVVLYKPGDTMDHT